MTEPLEVAVRAYTIWSAEPWHHQPAKPLRDEMRRPPVILVLDTETRTDHSQALLFASYRLYDVRWEDEPRLSCVEEGLIYADALPDRDPSAFEIVREYAATHAPAIDPGGETPSPILHLRSRSGFLDEIFRPAVIEARALLVCFNWPFDISRFALHWGIARAGRRRSRGEERRRSPYEGGFSLSLWGRPDEQGIWHDHPARPRILIKHIDSKRALKGMGSVGEGYGNQDQEGFRGHFLDLRTLAFALTDRGHTLESACDAFGVPYTKRTVTHGVITPEYVDYNREDVEATAHLYAAAMTEYLRHPIELQATRAFSPATLGKAYLEAMGITPPMARLGKIR